MTNQENIIRTFLATDILPEGWGLDLIEPRDGQIVLFLSRACGMSASGRAVFCVGFDPEAQAEAVVDELESVVERMARYDANAGYKTVGTVVAINPLRNEITVSVPASIVNRADILNRVTLAHTLDLAEPV
jgi:hypothetical protein